MGVRQQGAAPVTTSEPPASLTPSQHHLFIPLVNSGPYWCTGWPRRPAQLALCPWAPGGAIAGACTLGKGQSLDARPSSRGHLGTEWQEAGMWGGPFCVVAEALGSQPWVHLLAGSWLVGPSVLGTPWVGFLTLLSVCKRCPGRRIPAFVCPVGSGIVPGVWKAALAGPLSRLALAREVLIALRPVPGFGGAANGP